jgi:hypothetical protein
MVMPQPATAPDPDRVADCGCPIQSGFLRLSGRVRSLPSDSQLAKSVNDSWQRSSQRSQCESTPSLARGCHLESPAPPQRIGLSDLAAPNQRFSIRAQKDNFRRNPSSPARTRFVPMPESVFAGRKNLNRFQSRASLAPLRGGHGRQVAFRQKFPCIASSLRRH